MIDNPLRRKAHFKMIKADLSFHRELDEIRKDRFRKGIDEELMSKTELTRRMLNAPSYPKYKEELKSTPKKEDIRKNNRNIGGVFSL